MEPRFRGNGGRDGKRLVLRASFVYSRLIRGRLTAADGQSGGLSYRPLNCDPLSAWYNAHQSLESLRS